MTYLGNLNYSGQRLKPIDKARNEKRVKRELRSDTAATNTTTTPTIHYHHHHHHHHLNHQHHRRHYYHHWPPLTTTIVKVGQLSSAVLCDFATTCVFRVPHSVFCVPLTRLTRKVQEEQEGQEGGADAFWVRIAAYLASGCCGFDKDYKKAVPGYMHVLVVLVVH